ncbi:hypothetical protein BH18ACT7_BH18ACT7_03210 [soil metagenome]
MREVPSRSHPGLTRAFHSEAMDLSVFTLFAAAYAVVALVTVTAGRHLGNAPLLQATALAAACCSCRPTSSPD